jgi:O-antigen ligase
LLGWGYGATFVRGDPITKVLWERLGWEAPGPHNSFLTITLEVGFVGLFLMIIILTTALWRGLRCCLTGVLPLGYFSLVLLIGILINSLTEGSAMSQGLGWIVFNMLAFACGQSLSLVRQAKLASSRRKSGPDKG